jgi:hypothetical protein
MSSSGWKRVPSIWVSGRLIRQTDCLPVLLVGCPGVLVLACHTTVQEAALVWAKEPVFQEVQEGNCTATMCCGGWCVSAESKQAVVSTCLEWKQYICANIQLTCAVAPTNPFSSH